MTWSGHRWKASSHVGGNSFRFLNETRSLSLPTSWRDDEASLLWLYHLHYLDDLFPVDQESMPSRGTDLLTSWIRHNEPFNGVGWQPFPLSIRIVNIVKFLAASNIEIEPFVLESLSLQAATLNERIEYHLRANHLFENGKALLFAGSFLDGPAANRWIDKGLEILDAECGEQFLDDGAHFELSPMYHGAMLWNVCDLVALADTTQLQPLQKRRSEWGHIIETGLRWYRAMTHPDGEVSFFNDTALKQTPTVAAVERYAASLGLAAPPLSGVFDRPTLTHLRASGYIRIEPGAGHAMLIDVARVGPDYQPGHAHADTLSFELSLFGERVLVNSGTSTYERGTQRDAERGTGAHNSVVVNCRNSSDTWAGFRVGRRATPHLTSATQGGDGQVRVSAWHDGYRTLFGGAIHKREFTCTSQSITVHDHLYGQFGYAHANFFIHPEMKILERTASRLELESSNGQRVSIEAARGKMDVVDSRWHPEFGISVPNKCMRIAFEDDSIETTINW